jgi:hypothetical protein
MERKQYPLHLADVYGDDLQSIGLNHTNVLFYKPHDRVRPECRDTLNILHIRFRKD